MLKKWLLLSTIFRTGVHSLLIYISFRHSHVFCLCLWMINFVQVKDEDVVSGERLANWELDYCEQQKLQCQLKKEYLFEIELFNPSFVTWELQHSNGGLMIWDLKTGSTIIGAKTGKNCLSQGGWLLQHVLIRDECFMPIEASLWSAGDIKCVSRRYCG